MTTRAYPRVEVDTANVPAVGQAGGVLLTETVAACGLFRELSAALSPWRKSLAIHDPARVVTDLALSLALSGDTLSDVALLRAEPEIYGHVASDPRVSRTIDAWPPTRASRCGRSTPLARLPEGMGGWSPSTPPATAPAPRSR